MANSDALLQYAQLRRYDAWIKKYINASRASLTATDISDQTVDLDSLILTEKPGKKVEYMCTTESGSASIIHRPRYTKEDGTTEARYTAFRLTVENIRWESETKYMTKQTYTDQWNNTFVRFIERDDEYDTWSEWKDSTVSDSVLTEASFIDALTRIDNTLTQISEKLSDT